MSDTTDKMLDRYVYLHIDYDDWSAEKEESGITVHVKMDDEGIVVDAWAGEDECIATTHKLYRDMGVEVKEIEKEEVTIKSNRLNIGQNGKQTMFMWCIFCWLDLQILGTLVYLNNALLYSQSWY